MATMRLTRHIFTMELLHVLNGWSDPPRFDSLRVEWSNGDWNKIHMSGAHAPAVCDLTVQARWLRRWDWLPYRWAQRSMYRRIRRIVEYDIFI